MLLIDASGAAGLVERADAGYVHHRRVAGVELRQRGGVFSSLVDQNVSSGGIKQEVVELPRPRKQVSQVDHECYSEEDCATFRPRSIKRGAPCLFEILPLPPL